MNNSTLFLKRMLPTALALGTAWAARGQIGHEFGATWAAAIGIFALITLSGRADWIKRAPVIVALGAIAWGAGGMISYGKIVGYGHAPDFLNTSYGFFMLMVIGSLYGFMGGGVTGLAMEATPQKKIDWAALFTQMFVGGFLFWGFFIYQLEWFMTPPRSELWAACMGASLALGWYLYRNGFAHALRTAFFSALGAGFGFGFGDFLQRMGHASGISFNWWNVMEYSIGFFGGLGMAYGVFSGSNWPLSIPPNKVSNKMAWIFLLLLLPFINIIEAASTERMEGTGKGVQAEDPTAFAHTWQWVLWILLIAFGLSIAKAGGRIAVSAKQKALAMITLLYLAWYILLSNIVSAVWLTPKFVSQHLYWLNLVIVAVFFYTVKNEEGKISETPVSKSYQKVLIAWWAAAILLILLVSWIAVSTDYVHRNAQLRFE